MFFFSCTPPHQWQVTLKVRVSELRYRHHCLPVMVLSELYKDALSHFPLQQIGIITSYRRGQVPDGENDEGSNFFSVLSYPDSSNILQR